MRYKCDLKMSACESKEKDDYYLFDMLYGVEESLHPLECVRYQTACYHIRKKDGDVKGKGDAAP